jgi:hypothetical protein
MFNIFKKTSDKEKLQKQYAHLMEESFRLSATDRKAGDLKRAEAEQILEQMEKMS